MFAYVERKAKMDGKTSIVGPVDASIFINYRFKVNCFDREQYVGEPYNKDYYKLLWEESGFKSFDSCSSYDLCGIGEIDTSNPLYIAYHDCKDKGYEFKSPDIGEFDNCLDDMYELFIKSHHIPFVNQIPSKEQFLTLFGQLEEIIDYDMIQLVYFEKKLKAFVIASPNYGTLLKKKDGFVKWMKVGKIRRNPRDYAIWNIESENDDQNIISALFI